MASKLIALAKTALRKIGIGIGFLALGVLADTAAAITAYDNECARVPWRAKEHAAAAWASIKNLVGEEKATRELEFAVKRVLEQQKSLGNEAFCAAIMEKLPIVAGAEQ
jgi:hypothetical protein